MKRRLVHMCFRPLAMLGSFRLCASHAIASRSTDPPKMRRMIVIGEPFASFIIEMAEVIGGCFLVPLTTRVHRSRKRSGQSTSFPFRGDLPNIYQYRPSVDLSNPLVCRHCLLHQCRRSFVSPQTCGDVKSWRYAERATC